MHPGVGWLDLYFTVAMAQLLCVRILVGGGVGGGGGVPGNCWEREMIEEDGQSGRFALYDDNGCQ